MWKSDCPTIYYETLTKNTLNRFWWHWQEDSCDKETLWLTDTFYKKINPLGARDEKFYSRPFDAYRFYHKECLKELFGLIPSSDIASKFLILFSSPFLLLLLCGIDYQRRFFPNGYDLHICSKKSVLVLKRPETLLQDLWYRGSGDYLSSRATTVHLP